MSSDEGGGGTARDLAEVIAEAGSVSVVGAGVAAATVAAAESGGVDQLSCGDGATVGIGDGGEILTHNTCTSAHGGYDSNKVP